MRISERITGLTVVSRKVLEDERVEINVLTAGPQVRSKEDGRKTRTEIRVDGNY